MGIAVKFGLNTTLVALKMEISMQHLWYLSQISLLHMLLLVHIAQWESPYIGIEQNIVIANVLNRDFPTV